MSTAATILRAILALPPWYQDAADDPASRVELLTPVAVVVSVVAEGNQQLEAALISTAWHETRFARYVLEGRCAEGPVGARCDNGRARGAWQLWAVACPSSRAYPDGSLHSLEAEAICAARLLRGGYGRCRGRHPQGDWAGAFSAFRGGASCSWAGAAPRARTMAGVMLGLARGD